jgi:serine/threonine protein kinase
LGNYQVRALIGCGAMGAVYLAHDAVLDRPVALKVLLGSLAKSPEQLRRFQREARAAAPLSHPNIVRIYEAGVREGVPFIAMEYVDGESFDHFLNRTGAIPWRRALEIAAQMAGALACAHEHGVVHRDVKPSNMLLDDTGRLRLTDFGIARVRDQSTGLTEHDCFLGTPEFMAPEQCIGAKDIGPACDLFSLGVTLYRMIAGRTPFAGFSTAALLAAITHETPMRLNRLLPDVPDDVARLVAHLMEKDPAARPASAEAVAAAIEQLMESDGGASVMSAALDAFMRDQAKPRHIELWSTPTPGERTPVKTSKSSKDTKDNKKRGPALRTNKRRRFYQPVSIGARVAAGIMITAALLGAGYWYAAGTPDVVEAAPLLDKAVFAAHQRGVFRTALPPGPWQVRNIAWSAQGDVLLVAVEGQPDSTLAGANGVFRLSPEDGSMLSLVSPSAPWRGDSPQPSQPALTVLPAALPVDAFSAEGALLRVVPFGSGGEQVAMLRQPLGASSPYSKPLAVLPASGMGESLVTPDGASLIVAQAQADGSHHLMLHDLTGAAPARALTAEPLLLAQDSLTLTPDGAALLAVASEGSTRSLYRIEAAPGGRVEVIARADFSGPIALHPDGSHALASIGRGPAAEVNRIALDGSGKLTPITPGAVSRHAFLPNGSAALFVSSEGAASVLMHLPAYGAPQVVARFEDATLRGATVSASGAWAAAIIESPEGPALAVVDIPSAIPPAPVAPAA